MRLPRLAELIICLYHSALAEMLPPLVTFKMDPEGTLIGHCTNFRLVRHTATCTLQDSNVIHRQTVIWRLH